MKTIPSIGQRFTRGSSVDIFIGIGQTHGRIGCGGSADPSIRKWLKVGVPWIHVKQRMMDAHVSQNVIDKVMKG